MSEAQQRLDAWRDGERRLDAATDAAEIEALREEVGRLRDAYMEAVARAGGDTSTGDDTVGEPSRAGAS